MCLNDIFNLPFDTTIDFSCGKDSGKFMKGERISFSSLIINTHCVKSESYVKYPVYSRLN